MHVFYLEVLSLELHYRLWSGKTGLSVSVTINGLQLIVPQDEAGKFGTCAEAERWCPLQAVVAQVEVLEFTERLEGGTRRNK